MSRENTSRKYLTNEEIMKKCPVVFAKAPTSGKVSEQYTFINSGTIVEDLAKLGWKVISAEQRRQRGNDPSIFSKHMVIFEHPDMIVRGEGGDDINVRIALTNSHDGLQAFRFVLGAFRVVCSNGLILYSRKDHKFAGFRILHKGYSFEKLREEIAEVVENLPKKVEVMNSMEETKLNTQQKHDLALKALLVRDGISLESEKAKKVTYSDESIERILKANREVDESDSLWKVFNTIQENVIRGGVEVSKNGKKARKLRPIKGFERDLKINKELFEQALELVN